MGWWCFARCRCLHNSQCQEIFHPICFSQWKNTASTDDGYVTGLEPGTDHPNSKTFERDQGRLLSLAPEASHVIAMTMEVHDDVAGVQAVQQEIASIQGDSPVEVHDQPLSHLSG